MANIPLGDFAQARVTPQAAATRPDMRAMDAGRGAAALAQGIENVGRLIDGVAEQKQAQDQAVARIETARSALQDQVQVRQIADENYQKLINGEIDYSQADTALKEALTARQKPEVKGASVVDRANYSLMLERNEVQELDAWGTRVNGFKKDYGATQVQSVFTMLNEGAANPAMDPDALVKQGGAMRDLWVQMGNDPQQFDSKFQAFQRNVYEANFAANMNGTIDNPAGLLQLREKLANGAYWSERLGPEKAGAMIASIDRKIESIKTDNERDVRKQDKLAEQLVGDVADQVEIGQNPGPERLLQAMEFAKDRPELMLQLQEAKQVGAAVGLILERPRVEQEAWIAEQKSKLQSQGGTEKEYARLGRIETMLNRVAEARENNPFGDPVLAPAAGPLNFSDPASMGAELGARLASLEAVRESNPSFGMRLLQPAEAAQLTDAFKKTPPEKMAAFMAGLYNANGEKVYGLLMEQIGAKDPIMASAGRRLAVDLKAQRDPRIAVGIAKGRALLTAKDKALTMPKDAEIGAAFAEAYGSDKGSNGAYAGRPDDFRNDVQSAKAYYANLTAEAGDLSGEFNQDRWDQAIKDVVGTPVDIEGYIALPPIGMEPDKFESAADREIMAAVKRSGLNAGVFGNDFALRNVPGKPGLYFLINADQGGAIVRGKDGKTIGIDLND
jgi:hypothetical protein